MKYNSDNLKYAKQMRSKMTKEEAVLWNVFRAKRFYGLKFKRQVLIGNYIVDFLCEEHKLIVEVDGGQHNTPEKIRYDNNRSEYLKNNGYIVLRFWNNEINDNLSGVLEVVKQTTGIED